MLRRRAIQAVAAAGVLLLGAGAGPAAADGPLLPATVGATPTGRSLPAGFLGLSIEYKAVRQYTGRDPRAIDPPLLGLIRGLNPGQSPRLRIGGDSTDGTWWPTRGVIPRGISYALTKGWMRTTRALAADLRARLTAGINLAGNRPALAAAESRALLHGIGRRYLRSWEIGNEPDLYGVFAWYRNRRGHVVLARSRRYSMRSFIGEFSRWRRLLPKLPLVGPSFSSLAWMSGLRGFLKAEKPVRTATIHDYPLHNSTADPANSTYPSIPNLLADSAAAGIAQRVAPFVRVAHRRKRRFRVDEMNSVSGKGRAGVSDTFASALWVLDTLFNMAAVGVDGVNIHTLPGAAYEPFTVSHSAGGWRAYVHPEYYGMLLFARAFPPGARLLPVSVARGPVKVWATSARDGHARVVLINKNPTTPVTVQLHLPGAPSAASLQRLEAPSVDATSGVTLGGQTFDPGTQSGTLPPPHSEPAVPVAGTYSIALPGGSAALLTR